MFTFDLFMLICYIIIFTCNTYVNKQHYYFDMTNNMYYACINIIILHFDTNYGACQHYYLALGHKEFK